MLLEWLELVMWVLVGLVVWLGCAIVITQTEQGEARDAQRDRADGGCRRDVTGTGRVAGQPSQAENPRPATRRYADVEHDHRDYGDEDPPRYIARCRKCGGGIFRARDGLRCHECGLLAGRLEPNDLERVLEEQVPIKPIFDKVYGIARPPHVARRRDGIQLSDEAQAELLKKIFGEAE